MKLVAFALCVVISGCGSGGEGQPPRQASPPPSSIEDAQTAQRLLATFKQRIQANVAATTDPQDSDRVCQQRKARFGPTASVADRYGPQVARQLHILCPTYFVPLAS